MPLVIYTLLVIMALNVIGNAFIVSRGGAVEPKSARAAAVDLVSGLALIVWLLVVFV